MNDTAQGWALTNIKKKTPVFHPTTGLFGMITEFHTAPTNPAEGEASCETVSLTGLDGKVHRLVCNPNAFVILTPSVGGFVVLSWNAIQELARTLIHEIPHDTHQKERIAMERALGVILVNIGKHFLTPPKGPTS